MTKNLKPQILTLRAEGKTYNEIKVLLKCSKGTIAYHLGEGVHEKQVARYTKNRKLRATAMKEKAGGKCCLCGYSKCFAALEFHHLDPAVKCFSLSDAFSGKKGMSLTQEVIDKEFDKCVLLCANCHREVHAGLLELPMVAEPRIEREA